MNLQLVFFETIGFDEGSNVKIGQKLPQFHLSCIWNDSSKRWHTQVLTWKHAMAKAAIIRCIFNFSMLALGAMNWAFGLLGGFKLQSGVQFDRFVRQQQIFHREQRGSTKRAFCCCSLNYESYFCFSSLNISTFETMRYLRYLPYLWSPWCITVESLLKNFVIFSRLWTGFQSFFYKLWFDDVISHHSLKVGEGLNTFHQFWQI